MFKTRNSPWSVNLNVEYGRCSLEINFKIKRSITEMLDNIPEPRRSAFDTLVDLDLDALVD
jgi:hypothetical protein